MKIKYQEVEARELRDGDLLRIGSSTNYVLVADARTVDGRIVVTIYNGKVPNEAPTLRFEPDQVVSLSMRGAKP